jgi:hypothetical protein
VPLNAIRAYATGEDVRDWVARPSAVILFPYDVDLAPLKEPLPTGLSKHLRPYKHILENCVISGSTKKKETNLRWFEFRRLARAKFASRFNLILPQIATHTHFALADHTVAFKEKAQAIALRREFTEKETILLLAFLNSSGVLGWLKQECFSKREAEEAETDTYYEFSGGKVEQIPIPDLICQALKGTQNNESDRLAILAQAITRRAQEASQLALSALFAKSGEAYHDWNAKLSGFTSPDRSLVEAFTTASELRESYERLLSRRERLLSEMIALQEEIDWTVYCINGWLASEDAAIRACDHPSYVAREQLPFRLWAVTQGRYELAAELIPSQWAAEWKQLWRARLAAIRDDPRIRRLEQALYKRRWDEQWKLGNRWTFGRVAYAAEFIDAFEWWLSEKAEWWLEHKATGGPVSIQQWVTALWNDTRMQAAWTVVAEEYSFLIRDKAQKRASQGVAPLGLEDPTADLSSFNKAFKRIIDEETVPQGIPSAVPYEKLEARSKGMISAKVKALRGKLNVPRERFHLRAPETYLSARIADSD